MATPHLFTHPSSIKELCNHSAFSSIPHHYASRDPEDASDHVDPILEEEIPIIDFSILTKGTPLQRSQLVQELGQACEKWGFFMLVNHGVPGVLRDAMLDAIKGFFDMEEEDKAEHGKWKHVMDPIRYGTSFNTSVEDIRYWRDYLKVLVHPDFNSPDKPSGFREVLKEYTACTRALGRELLRGIWESLELEESSMNKALDLDSCFQVCAANLYPTCPQPELVMGLPAHSDHGLLTLLYQNDVDGLEIKHGGKWVRVKPPPSSFIVNTGDHIEIVSNGRYKSILHRATINGQRTRMSLATVIAPALDTVVEPAPELVSSEKPAMFRGMSYRAFVEHQQGTKLNEKSVLDLLRI